MKVEVWIYKNRYRGKLKKYRWQYRFFAKNLVGYILVKGNKRGKLSHLFSRTKLEKKNPSITYSEPDMIYTFELNNES